MKHTVILVSLAAALCAAAATVHAETYKVGPHRTYKKFSELPALKPGDVVEVDGNATYGSVSFSKAGTAAKPIVIRGRRVSGKRPIISGGDNTVAFYGNHYRFEGFEVTGGNRRCVFHAAHDITIRDTVVRNCPGQGILGADEGSGSLTLQYVEVFKTGSGDRKHQIYMSTDQQQYPGAVFRMEHCYIHDANGGHNVKSRAERNEIYYNWIEGAYYHELELIGPEVMPESLKREDSDVVGNVIRKTGPNSSFYAVRVGGDGTGQTWGRYRFVNNTFLIAGKSAVFRPFDGVESMEMHNNVFYKSGGARIMREDWVKWKSGKRVIAGSNNWVSSGSTYVPSEWKNTIVGGDPGFVDQGKHDLSIIANSQLVDAGATLPKSPSGYAFPKPLQEPLYHPSGRGLMAVGSAKERPIYKAIDIGAFEFAPPTWSDSGPSSEPIVEPEPEEEQEPETQPQPLPLPQWEPHPDLGAPDEPAEPEVPGWWPWSWSGDELDVSLN